MVSDETDSSYLILRTVFLVSWKVTSKHKARVISNLFPATAKIASGEQFMSAISGNLCFTSRRRPVHALTLLCADQLVRVRRKCFLFSECAMVERSVTSMRLFPFL